MDHTFFWNESYLDSLEPQSWLRYPALMASTRQRSTNLASPNGARPGWSAVAATARMKLEGLRFGERETMLRQVAEAQGVNPQTVRRALAALKFIEKIESQRFLKQLSLRAAPVAAIEHIARWYAYDRTAAIRAARRVAAGQYTVAALGAAEAAARLAAGAEGVGRSLTHRCRLRVGPVIAAQLKGYVPDRAPRRGRDEPSLDFRFRRENEERWSVAVLIIGPYRDRSPADLRLGDWIVKALGLAALYSRVILVVPTATLKNKCAAWLRKHGVRRAAFEIQVITPEP
jgi:hypothetical protein